MKIWSSGSSSSQDKREKLGEGDQNDLPLLDIGRQLVLQVMFSLPVLITEPSASKAPWCSTRTGRAPNGTKTEWKMNEYKAIEADLQLQAPCSSSNTAPAHMLRQEFSFCRVYQTTECLWSYGQEFRRPRYLMLGTSSKLQIHIMWKWREDGSARRRVYPQEPMANPFNPDKALEAYRWPLDNGEIWELVSLEQLDWFN